MLSETLSTAVSESPTELPFASREAMLGLSGKRAYKEVSTPIGKIRLRSLVGSEAFEIDNYTYDSKGVYDRSRERYARAKRFVETIVDKNGNKIFSDFDLPVLVDWPEPLANTLAVEILGMAKPESLGLFAKNA